MVTIHNGYAAGLRWRRHKRYVNGYWLGQYELPVQQALARELRPGDVFFDVGANAGFFTILAARLVGSAGTCVAFDPDPANIASIHEQCELNHLTWVIAIQEAVTEKTGHAQFVSGMVGSPTGHLAVESVKEDAFAVITTTLDDASRRFRSPTLVKLDVEGFEAAVLRGGRKILEAVRPRFLIEVHGSDPAREVGALLRSAKYSLSDLRGRPLGDESTLPRHILAGPL